MAQQDHNQSAEQLAASILPQAALRLTLKNYVNTIGMCDVFAATQRWHIAAMRTAGMLTEVRYGDELMKALAAPEQTYILIPADASISKPMLNNMLSACGLHKTILLETLV